MQNELTDDECEAIKTALKDPDTCKPKYCEGMREAIEKGTIKKVECSTHGINETWYELDGNTIERCMYCPDGSDCLREGE